MLDQLTAFALGLIQGVLEWLPISSRGNIVLLMIGFLGLEARDALGLSIYLHLGTALAASTYFRRDIEKLFRDKSHRKLLRFLVISTLTTGASGFPIYKLSSNVSLYGEALLALVGVALIVNGVVNRTVHGKGYRSVEALTEGEGVLIGLIQGLSAIPGVSRSGVTTSALLLRRFSATEALHISFLMSIPASLASISGLAVIEGVPPIGIDVLLLSVVASFTAGLLSVETLLRLARRIRFWSLCIFLGFLALLPILFNLI